MGVLSCNRNGCQNIMCDRYSFTHGYICDDCFEELVETRPDSIAAFMAAEKPEQRPDLRAFYDKEFPVSQ